MPSKKVHSALAPCSSRRYTAAVHEHRGTLMPNATIFRGLGLFVQRRFLDMELCRSIRCEMASGIRRRAIVRPVGRTLAALDETARRTDEAEVSTTTVGLIRSLLLETKPSLESHFRLSLSGCQRPRFYIYEKGDFFARHADRNTDQSAPEFIKTRQVSVSIFLNDQAGGLDHQSYAGGALIFHGRSGRDNSSMGIALDSEEGMCIAFPSDWVHEVQPTVSGRRYSIVSWFS